MAPTQPLHSPHTISFRASSWPHYDDEELAAALHVLRSGKVNYWTGGECRQFEQEYAEHVGVRHAVAVANGTVALELAMEALGIGAGDEVVVTPRTFIASASAAVRRGARAVFADIDPVTQNITADTIRPVLSDRTRGIVAVHLAGWPCDMDPILELARQRSIHVIEDCAQAHGATYKGRPVGSFGDIAAFSFCQDKIISTGGEGGMVVTHNSELWEKVWSLKDHGKSFAAVNRQEPREAYRWLHEQFGTNLRMTEVQAAIGRIQLRKLPDWLAARRRNAAAFVAAVEDTPGITVPWPEGAIAHAFYKLYAFIDPSTFKPDWNRSRVIATLQELGITCGPGSCSEIYLEKAFAGARLAPAKRLPVARHLGETSLMFAIDPTLTADDMSQIGDALNDIMRTATA